MTDLLPLLQEFYQDKLSAVLRHIAGARLVGQYDANNTYQYIISREETHVQWLQSALAEFGAALPAASAAASEPVAPRRGARVLRRVRGLS